MVKHVILWKLKEEYSAKEKGEIKKGIKEGLKGVVPGLLEIKVYTEPLESANSDLMLDSSFVDEDALKGYAIHPAHVEVANTMVRPFVVSRVVMDTVCDPE